MFLATIIQTSPRILLRRRFNPGRIINTGTSFVKPQFAQADDTTSGTCLPGGSCSCKCKHCGVKADNCSLFCSNQQCKALQRIDINHCNVFQLFGLPTCFKLSQPAIETAFKKLQWQLHPDKFSTKSSEEQQISTFNSSIVNDAYATLRDPVDRAQCLLTMQGIDVATNNVRTNSKLMTEFFLLREDIEEAGDIASLKSIKTRLEQMQSKAINMLEQCFDKSDFEAATEQLVRLQFLRKTIDEVDKKIGE